MKKNIIVILVCSFTLVINNSCRKALKNTDDYLPKVSITSAEIQADGSLLLTGHIDSKGYSPVEYAGFCCDTQTEPNIQTRQIVAKIDGSNFTASYTGLSVDSTYFFRSWATNAQGYKYGSEISLSNVIAPSITPACNLTKNYMDNGTGGGGQYMTNVGTQYNLSPFWEFTAYMSGGNNLSFRFTAKATTGIYTIDNSPSPASGNVYVNYKLGSTYRSLESGTKIYVNKLGGDTIDITICNAPWKFSSTSTYTMNTRLKCPY